MANYLDCRLEFDEDSKVFTRLNAKHDNFDFPFFSFLSSNIQESAANGVFVSQFLRYTCVARLKCEDFPFRGSILVSKLLKQGYYLRKLQSTLWKFYGRHIDLVHKFDTYVSHMLKGLFTNCNTWLLSSDSMNRDECHMWDRKCTLLPEHMISLHLRSS